MARPPLVLGTWGQINRKKNGDHWIAYARFRDYDGVTRQVERKGSTGRKAEDALVAAMRDRTRIADADMTGDTKVQALAEAWLDEVRASDRADSTAERYERTCATHVLPALGQVRLREVSVPTVDRFLAAVVKNAGAAAGKHSRVALTGMFALAVRHGAVATNPVRDARTVTTKRTEVQTIEVDQVATLRERLRAWDAGRDLAGNVRVTDLADPVDLLLATGMRTGELLALRWQDVNLGARPHVEVRATVVVLKERGLVVQERPKTDTSRRILLLPPFAAAMLERRRRERHSEMVFPSSVGTPRSPSNFRRQWRDFRAEHGYEEWVTPKTFRKTVATLVRDRVDLEAAGAQLGHASTKVTAEHYARRVHEGPDLTAVLEEWAR